MLKSNGGGIRALQLMSYVMNIITQEFVSQYFEIKWVILQRVLSLCHRNTKHSLDHLRCVCLTKPRVNSHLRKNQNCSSHESAIITKLFCKLFYHLSASRCWWGNPSVSAVKYSSLCTWQQSFSPRWSGWCLQFGQEWAKEKLIKTSHNIQTMWDGHFCTFAGNVSFPAENVISIEHIKCISILDGFGWLLCILRSVLSCTYSWIFTCCLTIMLYGISLVDIY